jgi:hypothetical protein
MRSIISVTLAEAKNSANSDGLIKLRLFALVQLVGVIIFLVFFIASFVTGSDSLTIASYAVLFMIYAIALWILFGAFKAFYGTDKSFGKSLWLFKVGVALLVIAGIAVIVTAFAAGYGAANAIATQSAPSVNSTATNIVFLLGLLFLCIGAVLYDIGACWGLWKIGVAYNNDLIKVGAILTTIISIPIVGQLLLYFGADGVLKSSIGKKGNKK